MGHEGRRGISQNIYFKKKVWAKKLFFFLNHQVFERVRGELLKWYCLIKSFIKSAELILKTWARPVRVLQFRHTRYLWGEQIFLLLPSCAPESQPILKGKGKRIFIKFPQPLQEGGKGFKGGFERKYGGKTLKVKGWSSQVNSLWAGTKAGLSNKKFVLFRGQQQNYDQRTLTWH